MANQELYNKTYRIPPDVLKYIQTVLVSYPTGNGVKRAKFILKNGVLTYQELKRLKNFFDHFNPKTDDRTQYALAGGMQMKQFIDTTLNQERNAVNTSKTVRRDIHLNPNSELHAYQTPRLSEAEDKKSEIEKSKNACAIIVNNDNKILLLKRANVKDIWMPGKWALVGGKIEKGESPQKAVEREIREETGLEINKFTKRFVMNRNEGSTEHFFACRYEGEDTDVDLNPENSNYGWFDTGEMEYLDTVPHLIEYITIAFKKYE